MDAVPVGEGLPMASLPPLQQLGFGASRWRLQGNATLGLRAGGRGHHLFFLAGQESAPGHIARFRGATQKFSRFRSEAAFSERRLRNRINEYAPGAVDLKFLP